MTKEKAIDILDDDMISGESVKDIRRALLFYGDHFMSCNQINRFFNIFLKIEKPKTGYWREVDINQYACSHCNHCFSIVPEDNSIEEYKYCPNCQARMVEPQEINDKCKNCEYYRNPDYIRCHECKAESEDKE